MSAGATTLPRRLEAVCRTHAGRTALIDGATRLSFGESADLVARVAAHLSALGVGRDAVVSFQLPNWWEAAILHHAILRAGGIPNPLDPSLRGREMRRILTDARPVLLAVPQSWRGVDHVALAKGLRDTWGMRLLVVRGDACSTLRFEDLIERPPPGAAPPPPDDPGTLALLLYTSGTTSAPKGVLHTHAGLLAEIETFPQIHDLRAADRYLGAPPIAHIAGTVYGVLTPFALGTSAALLERWEPDAALDLIQRERVTFMTGPPVFAHTLAGHPAAAGTDLSSFRLFSTGGATVSGEQMRRAGSVLGCVVKRAYGSTEMPTLTATTIGDDERARLDSDGRVIGDAAMRIVRPDGADAAPGETGEIWATGPELFAGYRDPGMNAGVLVDRWFRTGDLGTVEDDGLLHVTGRIKDIIIRGGENIAAAEIEDLLLEHPAVEEAAVIGLPDPRLGERVCAVVTVRGDGSVALDEVAAFLRAREIATHKLPERLVVWDGPLPRTDSGKIRKDRIRAALID